MSVWTILTPNQVRPIIMHSEWLPRASVCLSDESRRRGEGSVEPQQPKRLAPERCDSTSSLESRSSASGREGSGRERVTTKHSRKQQQQIKKLVLEEERGEVREGRGVADSSLSISVDWGALPSNVGISNGEYSHALSSAPSFHSGNTGKEWAEEEEEEMTPSTLVSFPLLYSARMDGGVSASSVPPDPTAYQTADVNPVTSAPSLPLAPPPAVAGIATSSVKVKVQPLPVETLKPVLAIINEESPLKRERGVSNGSGRVTGTRGTKHNFCLMMMSLLCNYV